MNGGTESSRCNGVVPEEQEKKKTMLKNEHNSSLETTPTPQWNEVLGEGEDVGWGER
jgi:hypothetical protein